MTEVAYLFFSTMVVDVCSLRVKLSLKIQYLKNESVFYFAFEHNAMYLSEKETLFLLAPRNTYIHFNITLVHSDLLRGRGVSTILHMFR